MLPQTIIGWDRGKTNSHIHTISQETGTLLKEGKIKNTPSDINGVLHGLPRPIRVVFEATGNWQAIYEILEDHVEDIQMAHPYDTKAIAHARIKTDRIDAGILATLGRADLVPQAWIPPRYIRDLREILRHRAFLVSLKTKVKNRIHSYLEKTGTVIKATDCFGKKGRVILRQCPLRPPYQTLLQRDLHLLEDIETIISQVTQDIETQAQQDPRIPFIRPIHGIGTYTAMLVLAEIGEIDRFDSPEQLVSYAGLCPSTYQSGKTLRHGRLTKQGSKWLRWVLVEAASRYAKGPGSLGDFYRRLMKRKGSKIARVALARKILHSIYWCLKKRVVYNDFVIGN